MDKKKIAKELLMVARELVADRVPSTVREWGLYADEDNGEFEGADDAARDLGKALGKAAQYVLRKIKSPAYNSYNEKRLAKMLGNVYGKVLEPVMDKYRDFGATDTEPRYVGQQYLVDIVKNHYDIKGFTDLADWM